METNLWLKSVILMFVLLVLCWVILNYRRKAKLVTTTYRIKVYSEEDSITLITYQDVDGLRKIWLYEKEWETTIKLPPSSEPLLMVSARYLKKQSDEPGAVNDQPLVSGEIAYKGNVLKEDKQKSITLEF